MRKIEFRMRLAEILAFPLAFGLIPMACECCDNDVYQIFIVIAFVECCFLIYDDHGEKK